MATVIRSAMLADPPFLLERRPGRYGADEPDPRSVTPLALDTAPARGPGPSLTQPEAVPQPLEAIEPAPASGPMQPAKPELSLDERDRLVREEIASAREQVLEQARREGYEEGLAQGRAALAGEIEALRKVVVSAGEMLGREIVGVEDAVIDIAFEAVCRIIGTTLTTREGVAAVVRELIRDLPRREQLVVRLSAHDFALLGDQAGTLLKGPDGLKLEFVADERVALGGCIVEVGGGTLDGRLETQLKQLSDTLLGAHRVEAEVGA